MSSNSRDRLNLAKNPNCRKMLQKVGDNFPDQEKIVLSVIVDKINKRGKTQARCLLITDKAVYNLKPKSYGKCLRRIDIDKIVSITRSTKSNEFAVHIPEEYDYRYRSKEVDMVVETIQDVYFQKENKKLHCNKIKQESMLGVIVTKDVARLQTREQRLRRYQELLGQQNFDDEVNDAKSTKSTKNLIDSKVKVQPNDFEFLKVIGRGSFGKVMQVREKKTGEIFAMKILKKKALIAKHQVEHTNAERKILQSLQHPFLMKLRFAFQTEAKLYFVLDYYRGGELFFHLKKKRRFSENEGRFFVAEVGMALGHLHSLDIVYRDLKPENILLDHTGHICLTDFGLSKDLGDKELANTFCGTPEYLAPEIVMNLGHGKPVDWWSLGILLYELTVGIPPFYSQNINEMYRKIQEAPLLFPPNLSNYCKQLVTRLLDRDPKKRLGSSDKDVDEILTHAFFKSLDMKKLYKKEIKPPYKPPIKEDNKETTEMFDKMFTNEKVQDSHAPKPLLNNGKDDGFSNFTFAPKKNIIDN